MTNTAQKLLDRYVALDGHDCVQVQFKQLVPMINLKLNQIFKIGRVRYNYDVLPGSRQT